MGRWRFTGQQRRKIDGGTTRSNGAGDNASGSAARAGAARENVWVLHVERFQDRVGARTSTGRSSVRVPTVTEAAGTASSVAW